MVDYWCIIYENVNYENRYCFDFSFIWLVEEEWKLVKKIDCRIMFWYVFIIYFFLNGIFLLMNLVYRVWIMFCGFDLYC